MKRVLGIINTFGLKKNSPRFSEVIESWASQEGDYELDVVISDNRSGKRFRRDVRIFCDRHGYRSVLTDANLTVFMTFNLVMKLFARDYDYVLYACEDVSFQTTNDIQLMLNDFNDDIGIITAKSTSKLMPKYQLAPSTKGSDIRKKIYSETTSPYLLKLHEIVCPHMAMMSSGFLRKYDFRWIDCLVHANFDEQLWFMVAGAGMRFGVCINATVDHRGNIRDGRKHPNYKQTYKIGGRKFGSDHKQDYHDLHDLCELGRLVGYGSHHRDEIVRGKFSVDESMYDAEGRHKNPKLLYDFLRANFFVSSKVFDYDAVKYEVYNDKCSNSN